MGARVYKSRLQGQAMQDEGSGPGGGGGTQVQNGYPLPNSLKCFMEKLESLLYTILH